MDRREAFRAMLGVPMATTFTRIPAEELKPDDVIAIEIPRSISTETAQDIHARLKAVWPDHKVIVLCDGMKLRIVSVQ